MSNIAIIAAAGNGERLNCNHSKMLAKIMGRPLLAYTLDQFEQSDRIDQIVLVVKTEDQKEIEEEILKVNRYKKISSIVLGGSTRQDSVYLGLKSIQESHGVACIHDGARPLVKGWMIEKTLDMVNDYDGVVIAVPVIETIKQALLDDMMVYKTVNRDEFWIVQTPQTFNLGYIKDLYQRAKEEELVVTDDASIVEHYGGRIKIVPGTRDNLKITTSFDLALAEVLMRKYL